MSEQPNALDNLVGIAPGHPLWSTTDAADIPALLAEIDRLRAALAERDAALANQALAYANLYAAVDALEGVVKNKKTEIARLRAALEGKDQ